MKFLLGFLIFIAGGMLGVTVMCMMFAAKEADRHIEKINNDKKDG